MLKAREGIQYNRGEDQTIETLKDKFNSYCPVQNIPYDQNPFYTCVERAGRSPPPSSHVGPLELLKKGGGIKGWMLAKRGRGLWESYS